MRKIQILTILTLISIVGFSQSIESIKADRNTYLWGEGNGVTLDEADKNALSMLINQISVSIESKFEMEKTENADGEVSNNVKSIVKTYSSNSLQNTERIVISQEPEAKVIRYIKRSDVSRIFANREVKIKEFCNYASIAIEELRISDAIKYYYWAYALLRSHPDQNEITYIDDKGESHMLAIWLPECIKQVISSIDIKVTNKKILESSAQYKLNLTYLGKPIEKLVYQYWTGQDYTNLIEARNGLGIVEFFGKNAADREKIQIKIEYIFRNESLYDKEIYTVIEKLPVIPVKSAYINLMIDEPDSQIASSNILSQNTENLSSSDNNVIKENESPVNESISLVSDISSYTKIMNPVIDAIENKSYASVKSCFTTEGYDVFTRLIQYGNAKIIETPELKGMKKGNLTILRSVPMLFSFQTNNRQFVENVVFYFNDDNKICDLSFSLSSKALNDIWDKQKWGEVDRLVIVDFLEHYKTAYALERIDYIESIFSDDALIITGTYKINPNLESPYKNNKIVQYNQYTKKEYVNRLKMLFRSKEYINLQFEKSDIRAGQKKGVYGIQIKQNYYSSNYGDEGNLFLLVDLQDTSKPTIHVRTWQPEPDEKNGIYGLEDF